MAMPNLIIEIKVKTDQRKIYKTRSSSEHKIYILSFKGVPTNEDVQRQISFISSFTV